MFYFYYELLYTYITVPKQLNFHSMFQMFFYVSSSVPQGSHLGLLFFLVFINDLPQVFNNYYFLQMLLNHFVQFNYYWTLRYYRIINKCYARSKNNCLESNIDN
jgi:hypothetical protein|uniref:Uncharacterized protein n=1 Tax=Sipha flava TaxID=143950 RepID=A0A2S2PV09_9HEMI